MNTALTPVVTIRIADVVSYVKPMNDEDFRYVVNIMWGNIDNRQAAIEQFLEEEITEEYTKAHTDPDSGVFDCDVNFKLVVIIDKTLSVEDKPIAISDDTDVQDAAQIAAERLHKNAFDIMFAFEHEED